MNKNDVLEQQAEERLSDIPTEPQPPEKGNSKKKKIITITAVIVIIIIILLLLQKCTNGGGPGDYSKYKEPEKQAEIIPNGDAEVEDETTTGANGVGNFSFGGYGSSVREFNNEESFNFTNLGINVLDEVFIVKYNDTEIWRSQRVVPNSTVKWYPCESLTNKGSYKLTLVQVPYNGDDACNGFEQELNIIVK